ncbi:hypothetical protein GCM10017608_32200 [Agromyces luteolus]|uniref:Uncharacterized protein n=1 Tax=Agromyces luteolus TaxID=88373 RepID=A0A7C9LCZ7_9MICO|nr:hypothetical protein [Agromyces luteolus]MUN06551.1 hypothetical protein [Agromyces luteolus]GLK29284.1 hypothetical protein GCM10017608_32200 [Agromyces luteolus]
MDESTGVGGGIADDHEFQVAQDGELPPEPAPDEDEDERPTGEDSDDDVVGIDAERRVVLPDERAPAADEV